MAEALYTIRHLLAGLLGDRLLVGMATGGTSTTLYDTVQLVQEDDDWNGAWLYIYEGPLAGQERLVSDFVQGSRAITVSPAWTVSGSWTAPTSASRYEIHRRTSVLDGYNPNILMALRSRRKRQMLAKTDETTTLVASTYEYSIPSGFAAINEIWRSDNAGHYSEVIPLRDVWVNRAAKKLVFDEAAALAQGHIVADRTLRIIGQAYQTEPTVDASTVAVNTTPIVWLAKAMMHAAEGEDAQMNAALKISELDIEEDETPLWPGSLIVEEG